MKEELRDKIIAFNRIRAANAEKVSDLDVIVAALIQLPPGQLKKVLTDDVLKVIKKYGYTE